MDDDDAPLMQQQKKRRRIDLEEDDFEDLPPATVGDDADDFLQRLVPVHILLHITFHFLPPYKHMRKGTYLYRLALHELAPL